MWRNSTDARGSKRQHHGVLISKVSSTKRCACQVQWVSTLWIRAQLEVRMSLSLCKLVPDRLARALYFLPPQIVKPKVVHPPTLAPGIALLQLLVMRS